MHSLSPESPLAEDAKADLQAAEEPFTPATIGRKICNLPTFFSQSITHYSENKAALQQEMLSAMTIAVLQVPESVAFSYVAGVEPISGMTATAIMGTITGAFGGRPAMVSGAQGAIAAVQMLLTDPSGDWADRTIEHRREILFMSVIFAGIFQIIMGFLQLAKFTALIPVSVMVGFLNGLAIITFRAQLGAFKKCEWCMPLVDGVANHTAPHVRCDEFNATDVIGVPFEDCKARWLRLDEGETWMVLLIVFSVMGICYFLPKVPAWKSPCGKIRPAKIIPPGAWGLLFATLFEHLINRNFIHYNTRTVKETAPLASSPPTPATPNISSDDWGTVMYFGFMTCLIGLIESLLTLRALDEVVGDLPSNFRNCQECVAQGVGNFLCGFAGSMGGGAMIGQSKLNVQNGARGRLSPFIAGISMFVIIIALNFVVDMIPVAGLCGVLFMIVINTMDWATFWPPQRCLLVNSPTPDAVTIVLVTALAVATDLAEAVAVGTAFMCICFAWKCSTKDMFKVKRRQESDARVTYHVKGPLFAGSTATFSTRFAPQGCPWGDEPAHVTINFEQSNLCDFSGVAALQEVILRYRSHDIEVVKTFHKPPGSSGGDMAFNPGWTFAQGSLVITSVREGSPAEQAGLIKGHRVLRVGNVAEELADQKPFKYHRQVAEAIASASTTFHVLIAEPRKVTLVGLSALSVSVLRRTARKVAKCGEEEDPHDISNLRRWLREALPPEGSNGSVRSLDTYGPSASAKLPASVPALARPMASEAISSVAMHAPAARTSAASRRDVQGRSGSPDEESRCSKISDGEGASPNEVQR
eukprot:TRINITY_DN17247_c0_g2_i1.p1 TRINITY_DN17247_c0_g2~~TRINITY_DN17247_c0_g2_i1.p1  ORF type:complete len:813 (+),score=214.46 TRINITY_DN17247_c0_g2_i1:105-2543(+)